MLETLTNVVTYATFALLVMFIVTVSYLTWRWHPRLRSTVTPSDPTGDVIDMDPAIPPKKEPRWSRWKVNRFQFIVAGTCIAAAGLLTLIAKLSFESLSLKWVALFAVTLIFLGVLYSVMKKEETRKKVWSIGETVLAKTSTGILLAIVALLAFHWLFSTLYPAIWGRWHATPWFYPLHVVLITTGLLLTQKGVLRFAGYALLALLTIAGYGKLWTHEVAEAEKATGIYRQRPIGSTGETPVTREWGPVIEIPIGVGIQWKTLANVDYEVRINEDDSRVVFFGKQAPGQRPKPCEAYIHLGEDVEKVEFRLADEKSLPTTFRLTFLQAKEGGPCPGTTLASEDDATSGDVEPLPDGVPTDPSRQIDADGKSKAKAN